MAGPFDALRAQLGVGATRSRDVLRAAVVGVLADLGYQVAAPEGVSGEGRPGSVAGSVGVVELVSIRYDQVVLSSSPQVVVRLRLDADRIVDRIADRLASGGGVGYSQPIALRVEVSRAG